MKKEAREAVKAKLFKEQRDLRDKIHRNKHTIKQLAAQQALCKRELGVLQDLIRVCV